jgi:hypothetical protein
MPHRSASAIVYVDDAESYGDVTDNTEGSRRCWSQAVGRAEVGNIDWGQQGVLGNRISSYRNSGAEGMIGCP